MNDDTDKSHMRMSQWLVLVACMLLFVAFRVPWIGHLLTNDEASNLCGVRAFAGGGYDYWSQWFWHHPPIFSTLLLLVHPLEAGFAERAEWLMLGVSALNLLMLFVLTRSLSGSGPALWTSFCYAVMPVARCYDLWLKQDSLAVLFGLLAIYAFQKKRHLYSGLALGLAFLAKEVAMFYAAGIAILWFLQEPRHRRFGDLFAVALVSILVSAWWYLLFSVSIEYFIAFAVNSSTQWTDVETWAQPWYFFLQKLLVDLGPVGILLCVVGLLVLEFDFHRRFAQKPWTERIRDDVMPAWFLAVLLTGYILFSSSRGKAAWFTSILYPLFAVPQGLGVYAILRLLENGIRNFASRLPRLVSVWPRVISGAMVVAFVIPIVMGGWGADYEKYLQKQYYWMWWGADTSRAAARMMNRVVKNGERVLITPMFYWDRLPPKPCAIFVYYLKPMPAILRRFDTPFDSLIADIRKYQIDWIMISPPPGIGENALIRPMMRKYGLNPLLLRGACIFKTDRIYKEAGANIQSHE